MPATEPTRQPRAYDATRRRENGLASRSRSRAKILDAAAALFLEHGYGATTVTAIAEAAGVSVPTLYGAVGAKADVLLALNDARIAGDNPDAALVEQTWVAEIAADPDPGSQLRRLVHESVELGQRAAPLWRIMREASVDEPAIAADLAKQRRDRYLDQHAFIDLLHTELRAGLDRDTAADILFGYVSPEVGELFGTDRGWTPQQLERLLADTLVALLLPEDARPERMEHLRAPRCYPTDDQSRERHRQC